MTNSNNFADDRAYLGGILEIMKKNESGLVARLDELRDQMQSINNAIHALSIYEHVNSVSEE